MGVTCPSDKKCDNDTGTCVDLCDKVNCTAPSRCKAGQCVNCNTPGEECDKGQMCLGGTCTTDPCLGVSCGNGQYCSNGTCVDLCTHIDCQVDERCVAGQCVHDPCAQKACGQGQYCDMKTGACKTDDCQALQCPLGQRCIQDTGKCAADPCAFIQCPAQCFACAVTSAGQATCQFQTDDEQCKVVRITTGQKGGGCSCSVDGGGVPSTEVALGLAVLGLIMTVRPRRRRS
jgi:MYXO-CTERM domain-containing protein